MMSRAIAETELLNPEKSVTGILYPVQILMLLITVEQPIAILYAPATMKTVVKQMTGGRFERIYYNISYGISVVMHIM